MTAGILYYSDCRLDHRIATTVRRQIARCAKGRPVVSVTLKPVAFGKNIVLPLERGQMTMFRQIRAGLEAIQTDIVFFCEHDVAYHPSHFEFVPPRDDVFYYNINVWRLRFLDGHAVRTDVCQQTSGLCARRSLLIQHYKKRIDALEVAGGYERHNGFEPGTNRWARQLDGIGAASWSAAFPNIDIRHHQNLTLSKWSPADYRNRRHAVGWQETDGAIPGWGTGAEIVERIKNDGF